MFLLLQLLKSAGIRGKHYNSGEELTPLAHFLCAKAHSRQPYKVSTEGIEAAGKDSSSPRPAELGLLPTAS